MPESSSSKIQFAWCTKEERFVPAVRCLVCKTSCPERRPSVDTKTIEALVQAGRIKETFVMTAKTRAKETPEKKTRYFLLDNGSLRELQEDEYSRSTIYEAVSHYSVERRFVRPEEKNNILYEGKKPPKKTTPLLVLQGNGEVVLSSWEELEAEPEKLAAVSEVIVARPVKQVFVLKQR